MKQGVLRRVATWETWDEPARYVAVAKHVERDIAVVFPLTWAARHGQRQMIAQAKERIRSLEAKTGRTLVPGSVLLAFSRHAPAPRREQQLDPDVRHHLLPALTDG